MLRSARAGIHGLDVSAVDALCEIDAGADVPVTGNRPAAEVVQCCTQTDQTQAASDSSLRGGHPAFATKYERRITTAAARSMVAQRRAMNRISAGWSGGHWGSPRCLRKSS